MKKAGFALAPSPFRLEARFGANRVVTLSVAPDTVTFTPNPAPLRKNVSLRGNFGDGGVTVTIHASACQHGAAEDASTRSN